MVQEREERKEETVQEVRKEETEKEPERALSLPYCSSPSVFSSPKGVWNPAWFRFVPPSQSPPRWLELRSIRTPDRWLTEDDAPPFPCQFQVGALPPCKECILGLFVCATHLVTCQARSFSVCCFCNRVLCKTHSNCFCRESELRREEEKASRNRNSLFLPLLSLPLVLLCSLSPVLLSLLYLRVCLFLLRFPSLPLFLLSSISSSVGFLSSDLSACSPPVSQTLGSLLPSRTSPVRLSSNHSFSFGHSIDVMLLDRESTPSEAASSGPFCSGEEGWAKGSTLVGGLPGAPMILESQNEVEVGITSTRRT